MRAARTRADRNDRRGQRIVDRGARSAREFRRRLDLLDGEALLTLCHKPRSWAVSELLRLVASKRGGA